MYLPDLPVTTYSELLAVFSGEFTYAFGGCTIIRGLDGNYLARRGQWIPDRVNLIYTDTPFALPKQRETVGRYMDVLREIAFDALHEEVVLVVAMPVFHSE